VEDDISLGELHRRLITIETDLKEDIRELVISQTKFIDQMTRVASSLSAATNSLSDLDRRVGNIESVQVATVSERVITATERIRALESFNVWLVRTILGALIVSAIAFLLTVRGTV